ncbi:hypothetical protein [Streptomyces sp. NPDC056105]|uniref:hypothetical protein n=1 Tax=Streptomyces sp. NPDC056105 TaxID=3345714 RepID=UPI0035DA4406
MTREDPFCGEGANCLGTDADADADGNACVSLAGDEEAHLTDTREALRALILDVEAGKADHLL